MRDRILNEIRHLAEASGGVPPGKRTFYKETGIRESEWLGVYWARWSDAITEAGYAPNRVPAKITEDEILRKFAEAYRKTGKLLTAPEIRLYARAHKGFPAGPTVQKTFPSRSALLSRLATWIETTGEFTEVGEMLSSVTAGDNAPKQVRSIDGSVYLLRSGSYYKIGRSEQIERRVKAIRVALPDAAQLIHEIKTDDPPGIEAYWHRRFADHRMNGEWFKLSASDVAAFKRRKFQ